VSSVTIITTVKHTWC